jgi:hypothetical protein
MLTMTTILNYLLGYGAFLLGAILFILGKMNDYDQMARANPDPKVIYDRKTFFRMEAINFARLFIGGIALVIFAPMLIGGVVVDVKNSSGAVVTTLALKAALAPFYFVTAYAGNSALFAFFGKYKKAMLGGVGVDDDKP